MPATWRASMISPAEDFRGAPLLRKEFDLDEGSDQVLGAVLRASARGVFEAFLNAERIGDEVLSPGWSSYEWRLRYRSYDVTELVKAAQGRVVIGFALGNGWYRGRLGWTGGRAFYGDELGAVAQLEITYTSGHRQLIGTDETWSAGPSAVLENDLYDGQIIDARLRSDEWLRPGWSGHGWVGTTTAQFDATTLTPSVGPPVVRHEELPPVRVWTSPAGKTLLDFGQNLVGWLKFSVRGTSGGTITIRHAEVLEHGELGTRPLRSAHATDTLILSGGEDFFEPTFTFHGFRYAEVSGWPGELTCDSLVAVVVHSAIRRIGEFSCSDPLLNQLHSNVVWSQRGNFLDLPTDCPQRDERLGWTGDLAVFAPSAAYLFDIEDFLRDWLADLAAEQGAAHGFVPFVVPDLLKYEAAGSQFSKSESAAIWGDVAVWAPWALWQAYGKPEVLRESFPSMVAHVSWVEAHLSETGLWDHGRQLGDWLDPTAPPDEPSRAKADKGVVATACLYRSASLLAAAAGVVGRPEEVAHFQGLADRTRAAFNRHYVGADGRVRSDCPTVYALAITFGLLDEPQQQLGGARLAELVAANGFRVATGFAGTPYVSDALTITGHLDEAYRLLLERECPSWLYPVTMGATTIWERWDSMLPDGTINPGEMTSFNHYALGAVVDWMHRVIGGIAPAEPGYSRVRIAPRPGGGLTWASTSLSTPRGRVSVSWTCADEDLTVEIELPDGVTADVDLPGAAPTVLTAGRHTVVGVSTGRLVR